MRPARPNYYYLHGPCTSLYCTNAPGVWGMKTEPRQQIAKVLNRLVRQSGIEGAEIIQRDGQCILECYRPDLDLSTFSRLSATLTAAGESVLPEMRATRAQEILTEADGMTLAVVPASDQFLLAALANSDRPDAELVAALRDAARDIGRLSGPTAG